MAASTGRQRAVLWLLVFAATAGLLAAAAQRAGSLGKTAGLVPRDDPYVRLNREITAQFGMENPVVWVIEARRGTVWTPELLTRVQLLTREAFKIPGVVPADIISLASPNLRDVEFTETGGMRPVYLMGQVPETAEDVAALRRRVEGDPNYRGNLTSLDDQAAMVVANFRADADAEVIATRATELKEKYTDELATVYAAGAPLLARVPPEAIATATGVAAALVLLGLAVTVWLLGARATLLIGITKLLAVLWAAGAVIALGLAALPWTIYALPATALLAVAIVLSDDDAVGRKLCVAVGLAVLVGAGVLAWMVDGPARAMGVAMMAGALAAMGAGTLCKSGGANPSPGGRWARNAALCVLILSALGLPRLHESLGLAGYGQRYPLGSGAADLRVIARHFPPPTALAIRVRGKQGFVSSPELLHAFDRAIQAARQDPAVVNAMSLADIVKMVNWAFNEKRDEFLVIPDDSGTIGRNLMLAYSPGFGRFVDRALATSAMWVYVRGDNPADLSRVLDRVKTALLAQPLPGAEVDLVGGDGAEILVMARTARQLALAAVAGLLATAVVVALLGGIAAGIRAALGGVAAVVVATGVMSGLNLPMDLITIPLSIGAGIGGAAFGALGAVTSGRLIRLGVVLVVMAVPMLLIPYAGAQVLGAIMLGAATVSWVSRLSTASPA
jgi:predicted RND superfamily exporter protein